MTPEQKLLKWAFKRKTPKYIKLQYVVGHNTTTITATNTATEETFGRTFLSPITGSDYRVAMHQINVFIREQNHV